MNHIKIHLNGQIDNVVVRSLHTSKIPQTTPAETTQCEITNITLCGAMILVPENSFVPETRLKLTLPSETINQPRDTIINAEIRCSDSHSFAEHTRLTLSFTGLSRTERQDLKNLLLRLESPWDTRLPGYLAAA